MRRTTLVLDEELYRAVKRKAVDRGRPVRALLEEALRMYLGLSKKPGVRSPAFEEYLSRVAGPLRRSDIYGGRLSRKVNNPL